MNFNLNPYHSMTKIHRFFFFMVLTASCSTVQAFNEEQRIALIIGNSNYQNLSRLENAANDAQDMSRKLESMGFDVITGLNLTKKQMRQNISLFDKKIRQGNASQTVALFFYAGHGLEVEGKNYIVPIDADMQYQEDAEYEGIVLGKVTKRMERSKSRLNLIILDACRNNPLPQRGRSLSGGWGSINASAKGTFIAFGTSPGRRAADSDGQGKNGLFTKHILKYIDQEGYTLEQVFKKVRDGVFTDSKGKQVTWQNNATTGDFYFKPGDARSIAIVVEKRPKWLYPLIASAAVFLAIVMVMYFRQRKQIAWAKSVVLSQELKKDARQFSTEVHRSRLMKDEVVGYLKDLNNNKIIKVISAKKSITIGRQAPADIIINDDVISSQHAQIGYNSSNKSFWLKDLNSSNGIWLSASEQISGHQEQALKNGQVFYLANQDHPLVLVKS